MFIFCSLPGFKDGIINVRLRLCYCCSALCLTLIQTWRTLVVTGTDDNGSGFSECEIRNHVGVSRHSCRERQRVYRLVSGLAKMKTPYSLRSDRYCVSLIDTDQSRNTGKYYDS